MRKTGKVLSFIFGALMLAWAVPQNAMAADIIDSGYCGDIEWSLDTNGHLILSGSGDLEEYAGNQYDYQYPWDEYADYVYSAEVNISDCTSLSDLFACCYNIEEVDLSNLDTSDVIYIDSMFSGCKYLETLDLSHFDTSNVETMSYMFSYCYGLESVDLSGWDTSNVEYMDFMFLDCYYLEELDLSSFDTSNVMYMNGMFMDCYNLTELDLSGFDTSNVINMELMFGYCEELKNIDLSNFDTRNVQSMWAMFKECYALNTLDLSNFDTSQVWDMEELFLNCSSLQSLNLSGFDMSSVDYYEDFLTGCNELTEIYTPLYLYYDITLPVKSGTNWVDSNGNVYRELPYGEDVSIYLERVKKEVPKTNFVRVAGDTRYETSFAIADTLKEELGIDKFESVIIASGTNFADALGGSYLAYVKKAPIIMSSGKNESDLKAYIQKNMNPNGTVYILGGTSAVPAKVENALSAYNVIRLSGKNRYETNLAILDETGIGNNPILIATGTNFADSLSASASKLPILLVGKSLTNEQKDFLYNSSGMFYILGGTSAVSEKVEREIDICGIIEKRIGGKNRYETSVMIAEEFVNNPAGVVLTYAMNFPDGLCGGVLAAYVDSPLILTANGKESESVNYTSNNGITTGAILGGDDLITDQTVNKILLWDQTEQGITEDIFAGYWLQKGEYEPMQLAMEENGDITCGMMPRDGTIEDALNYVATYEYGYDELAITFANLDGYGETTLYYDLEYKEETLIRVLTLRSSSKNKNIDTSSLYGLDEYIPGTYVQVKLKAVGNLLNVPSDIEVDYVQSAIGWHNKYEYFETIIQIYEDGELVAYAGVDAYTGKLARKAASYGTL